MSTCIITAGRRVHFCAQCKTEVPRWCQKNLSHVVIIGIKKVCENCESTFIVPESDDPIQRFCDRCLKVAHMLGHNTINRLSACPIRKNCGDKQRRGCGGFSNLCR